jgi:hypothetical protein
VEHILAVMITKGVRWAISSTSTQSFLSSHLRPVSDLQRAYYYAFSNLEERVTASSILKPRIVSCFHFLLTFTRFFLVQIAKPSFQS